MKFKITHTAKGGNQDILALCNKAQNWSVSKYQAIREIEAAGKPYADKSPYYTEYMGQKAAVVVVVNNDKKYLRTDPDKTTKNNLLVLSDC